MVRYAHSPQPSDICDMLLFVLFCTSHLFNEDDFDYDEDSDLVEPKPENEFLKRIEESCGDLPDKEKKLTMVRNKVLDKLKRTLRRERLSSRGSVSSLDSRTSSRTRLRSKDDETDSEQVAKQSKQQAPLKTASSQSKLPTSVSSQHQS